MDKKEVLDIYREQFIFEMDRKKDITSQAQVRFAFIATGATLLIYMIRNVDLSSDRAELLVFVAFSIISACLLFIAAYQLANAFWGNSYTYLPPMDETESYRKQLLEKYPDSDAEELFEDYLIEEYSECSGENRKTNNDRQKSMNNIVNLIKLLIVPFLATGLLFLLLDMDASSARKPYDVKIISAETSHEKLRGLEKKNDG